MPVDHKPGALARAGALLEAVARDCEDALDAEVPLRCGRAADLLEMATTRPAPIPLLPDRAVPLRTAVERAHMLLVSLPIDALSDAVLDAIVETRAALRAARTASR